MIALVVTLLGWGAWRLAEEREALMSEADKLQKTADDLKNENASLESQIRYYQEPANLLKALKSQFNYKEPGERLIIVVPSESTSSEAANANPQVKNSHR